MTPLNVSPPTLTPKTSGLAIASLVLGILSFFTCGLTMIPAIICGIIALNQISAAKGAIAGKGQAIAGLVTGGCSIFVIAILAGLLLPALAQARWRARRVTCMSNMKQIALGVAQYYDDHTNTMPHALSDVLPYVGGSDKVFVCPEVADQSAPSYQLVPGVVWGDSNLTIMVTEPDNNHRGQGHNACYNDGHVEWVPKH